MKKAHFNTNNKDNVVGKIHIDDSQIAELLGRTVPPKVADLVEVAEAVQFVDRMNRRPGWLSAGESWSRELRLVIGVRQPERWRRAVVVEQLIELLTWLTDDVWDIEFTLRSGQARLSERLQFLFPFPFERNPSSIALYSGGLDSFAGLVLDVASGTNPLLVSVVSNSRQDAAQSKTVAALQAASGATLHRVAIPSNLQGLAGLEPTHRTRPVGFLTMAACIASMMDIRTIRVYENGVGAINLPCSRAQIGAQATKSMHPGTLNRAERLLSLILEHPIRIINPNQYRTKGEMCGKLPHGLLPAIRDAPSCDTAYAHRATKIPNCGHCTSCLLRRQALYSAGLEDYDNVSQYRTDALSVDFCGDGNTEALQAMLAQTARMDAALRSNNPWPRLVQEFPEILDAEEALTSNHTQLEEVRRELMHMYRRYVAEWSRFPIRMAGVYLGLPEEE